MSIQNIDVLWDDNPVDITVTDLMSCPRSAHMNCRQIA